MGFMDILQIGNIVTTSYSANNYLITDISSPCTCPSTLDLISGAADCSERHFHVSLVGMDGDHEGGNYHLNGFRQDGSSIWSDGMVFLVQSDDQIAFSF